ncbi:MAG: hypothetical protein U0163_06855 [Gemmatimonadaceae bacterium]
MGRRRRSRQSVAGQSSLRELLLIREIVHAFLHADRPNDVFQFALDRVARWSVATFASVYLVDGASEVMHLAAFTGPSATGRGSAKCALGSATGPAARRPPSDA